MTRTPTGPSLKLTALQRVTLGDIGRGSVLQRNMGYAAWRIVGGNPQVVGRLISLGLAEWGPHDGDRIPCRLTDAGAQQLSAPAA